MPNQITDDQRDDFTDEDDLEGDEGMDTDTGDGGGDSSGDGDSADKRIRDLQSRADKAEARANRLEKLLQEKAKDGDSGEGNARGSNDPEREALMQELREVGLDAVYGEFAELKEYGIDRALIEGSSRAEIRESATRLVGLIKSVETKARNKTLREHGIKGDPAGATRQPPKNYAEMSDEDIEKEIARVRGGGPSFWG